MKIIKTLARSQCSHDSPGEERGRLGWLCGDCIERILIEAYKAGASNADPSDTWFVAAVPARLKPYIDDLLATGLYGLDREDAVVHILERGIERAVRNRLIALRMNGKKVQR